MNTQLLKYAVEVEKTGSISKAAENLYINQPRLSKAIRELENIYGITVFKRTSKGVVPTKNGEMFLDFAKKILSQLYELEAMCKPEAGGVKKFDISVPRASYISVAFTDFLKQLGHEQIKADYRETNSMRTIKNILEDDYKLGILRYAENYDRYYKSMMDEKGLEYELVTQFSYMLVMNEKSPVANKENICFEDLEPLTEIAHADPYVPSLPFAEVKKEELHDNSDRQIFVFERSSQFELLSKNPETYMWVSPLPKEYLTRYGLIQRTCGENSRVYRDMLIHKKEYTLTNLDKMFIEQLVKTKREVFGREE